MAKLPIIVEGPDGAGKTTLAKKLCKALAREYRRPSTEDLSSSSGPGGIGLVEWWDKQLGCPPSELQAVVYDRCFYISDPIYQQAQPERMLLIPSDLLARGIMRLWNVEPILVFCLPPWEVQHLNVLKAGRDRLEGVDDNMLQKVNNQYHAYYAMWANGLYDNVMAHDYTQEGAWSLLLTKLRSVR